MPDGPDIGGFSGPDIGQTDRSEIPVAIMPAMGIPQARRVAIIGAGTAGPAAGALLARRGWRADVFERAAELRPIGAGLLIQPTGQFVLAQLGQLGWLARRGARIHRLTGMTRRGRPVLDATYADLDPSMHGIGVSRGTLFRACMNAFAHECQQGQCVIHQGHEVVSVTRRPDGPCTLRCKVAAGDAVYDGFDLVLVCDGARSVLRPAWARSRAYPWGATWCVLPDEDRVIDGELAQVYDGVGVMVGFMPIGCDEPGQTPRVAMYWSLRADAIEALLAGKVESLGAFRARIVGLMPRAEKALSHLRDWSQLIGARYFDAVTSPAFDHGGRVIYLGDAAHAMSPQLGQGANLALWDAWELSRHMPRGDEAIDDGVVRRAAEAWWRSRKAHTRFYRLASRWMTPWFQGDWRVLGAVRDVCMYPGSRVPWVRRQMVQSLVGVKTGLLSTMELPVVSD